MCVIVLAVSMLVFLLMQTFSGPHCLDCGARVGFPFTYTQEGTFATLGHFIWLGFLGDYSIALAITVIVIWLWRLRQAGKVSVD
jgi:hypothetical protein